MTILDDAQVLQLADMFHTAAFTRDGWYSALDRLAHATGSRSGQLICLGAAATVPLNIVTNTDPDALAAFVALKGGDPDVNPRVRAGLSHPVLKVLAESDFIDADEYARDAHYQGFAREWDIPYCCLTTLDRSNDMLIGLSVLRSKKQGHIDLAGRAIFAAVAPHVRAAVRTHIALEGHGDALIAGALEAVGVPAFICDRGGQVRAMTPAAEDVIACGNGLQLRDGRLCAPTVADSQALTEAITAAAAQDAGRLNRAERTVVIRSSDQDSAPMVVDVTSLSANHSLTFNFSGRVLVLLRGATDGGDKRRAAILQSVYGMTAAETEIALQLFGGNSPDVIASARGVSVGTVRAQIKALLAKAGVRRQVELVAHLGRL